MKSRFDIGFSPMDRLDRSINAIDALGWMLYHALETGDGQNHIADGVHTLMTSQCRELDETAQALADEIQGLKAEQTAISRKLATNSTGTGISVNSDTNSTGRPSAEVRAVSGDYYRLQQEFVADQIAAGKTPDEIGTAMLLHPSAIKRMIEAMPDRETREVFDRQEGRIVLRLGKVADTAEIAQALNLKQATVERVADMLRGGAKSSADGGRENAA